MNLRSVAPFFRLFVRAAALCAGWLVCSFFIGAQSVPATNSDPSDLILVNGNPLADLTLVADPAKNFAVIMKDGKLYKGAP